MVTEMETAFNTFKKSFKYTLRHFHEVHKMCEQFTFKTFNNECKKKKIENISISIQGILRP